ncbi:hypothetical protein [Bordetella ansorpii]|nr:hypothetical protein [Bordetella ansorpii]
MASDRDSKGVTTMLPGFTKLAMLLPREGRTLRAFLWVFAAFGVLLLLTWLYVQAYGQSETFVSWILVGGLGITFYCMLVLWGLVAVRRLVRFRARSPQTRGKVPAGWSLLLWPYRKGDIERIDAAGRLAELMTFTFVLISVVGLALAVVLPH